MKVARSDSWSAAQSHVSEVIQPNEEIRKKIIDGSWPHMCWRGAFWNNIGNSLLGFCCGLICFWETILFSMPPIHCFGINLFTFSRCSYPYTTNVYHYTTSASFNGIQLISTVKSFHTCPFQTMIYNGMMHGKTHEPYHHKKICHQEQLGRLAWLMFGW
jgi:hypothetical protein